MAKKRTKDSGQRPEESADNSDGAPSPDQTLEQLVAEADPVPAAVVVSAKQSFSRRAHKPARPKAG